MAIDTPATLGIIGAGPVGLETCLYARFLGYDVIVWEQATAGHRLLSDETLGLFGDFSTPLGRAAIMAQAPDVPLPRVDEMLTCRQWHARYLLPLAESDLIVDSLRQQQRVMRVAKYEMEGADVSGFDRGGWDFVVETTQPNGVNEKFTVDCLIDASGCRQPGEAFSYHAELELGAISPSSLPPPCQAYGDELPDGTKLIEEAKALVLHEPNFYLLGEKHAGALPHSKIMDQIRALFTILGDRPTLDLYATAVKLPQ